ncbi:MAG: S8 family serine peptidase [Candidatus Ancillula sp.]|jgi:subtilisin family serine protease|nr:S8 family serine peptidase [Candidatus Ancillula sp.]
MFKTKKRFVILFVATLLVAFLCLCAYFQRNNYSNLSSDSIMQSDMQSENVDSNQSVSENSDNLGKASQQSLEEDSKEAKIPDAPEIPSSWAEEDQHNIDQATRMIMLQNPNFELQLKLQGLNLDNMSEDQRAQVPVEMIFQANGKDLKSAEAEANKITGQVVEREYTYLLNGFEMKATLDQLEDLKKCPDITYIELVGYNKATDINADALVEAIQTWNSYNIKGEGMVVADIDSGVDCTHKDLRLSEEGITAEKINPSQAASLINQVGHGYHCSDKVPYSYNYADMSSVPGADQYDTFDSGSGVVMHGMHVAGLIAANGLDAATEPHTSDIDSIIGSAPEAQLINMKIGSNLTGAMGNDSIIAAIEDSVKLGADVMNMSFGSYYPFQSTSEPIGRVVTQAAKAGVLSAVAAGNSAISSSNNTSTTSIYSTPDDENINSPGVSSDALSVASANNSDITSDGLKVDGNSKFYPSSALSTYFEYQNNVQTFNSGQYRICALDNGNNDSSRPSDKENYPGYSLSENFPKNEQGKADITYCFSEHNKIDGVKDLAYVGMNSTETFQNAVDYALLAGADGVIIHRQAPPFVAMSASLPSEYSKFPIAIFKYNQGQSLYQYIKDQNSDHIYSLEETQSYSGENPDAGKMSDFTSWGPTADLRLKPEITSIGGNLWSLANNNQYQDMSGTSMATPVLAGGEALLLQHMKKLAHPLSGINLVHAVKNISMNTAVPLRDKNQNNAIYSPRQQGAGQLNVKAALDSSVIATDPVDGDAAIELKEFNTKTPSFSINLSNSSSENVKYSFDDFGGVYQQIRVKVSEIDYSNQLSLSTSGFEVYGSKSKIPEEDLHDQLIDGANISTTNNIITVPAGQNVTVTFSLSLGANVQNNNWVEGFVGFKPVDSTDTPEISVPYFGYFGSRDEELSIIDDPAYCLGQNVQGYPYFLFDTKTHWTYDGGVDEDVEKTGFNVDMDAELRTMGLTYQQACSGSPNNKTMYGMDSIINGGIDKGKFMRGDAIMSGGTAYDARGVRETSYGINPAQTVVTPVYYGNYPETYENVSHLFQTAIVTQRPGQDLTVDIVDSPSSDAQPIATLLKVPEAIPSMAYSANFSGYVFNQSTGKYELIPQGQYYVRESAINPATGVRGSYKYLPFKYIETKPEASFVGADWDSEAENVNLKVRIKDSVGLIQNADFLDLYVDLGKGRLSSDCHIIPNFKITVDKNDPTLYSIPLQDCYKKYITKGENEFQLYLFDNAAASFNKDDKHTGHLDFSVDLTNILPFDISSGETPITNISFNDYSFWCTTNSFNIVGVDVDAEGRCPTAESKTVQRPSDQSQWGGFSEVLSHTPTNPQSSTGILAFDEIPEKITSDFVTSFLPNPPIVSEMESEGIDHIDSFNTYNFNGYYNQPFYIQTVKSPQISDCLAAEGHQNDDFCLNSGGEPVSAGLVTKFGTDSEYHLYNASSSTLVKVNADGVFSGQIYLRNPIDSVVFIHANCQDPMNPTEETCTQGDRFFYRLPFNYQGPGKYVSYEIDDASNPLAPRINIDAEKTAQLNPDLDKNKLISELDPNNSENMKAKNNIGVYSSVHNYIIHADNLSEFTLDFTPVNDSQTETLTNFVSYGSCSFPSSAERVCAALGSDKVMNQPIMDAAYGMNVEDGSAFTQTDYGPHTVYPAQTTSNPNELGLYVDSDNPNNSKYAERKLTFKNIPEGRYYFNIISNGKIDGEGRCSELNPYYPTNPDHSVWCGPQTIYQFVIDNTSDSEFQFADPSFSDPSYNKYMNESLPVVVLGKANASGISYTDMDKAYNKKTQMLTLTGKVARGVESIAAWDGVKANEDDPEESWRNGVIDPETGDFTISFYVPDLTLVKLFLFKVTGSDPANGVKINYPMAYYVSILGDNPKMTLDFDGAKKVVSDQNGNYDVWVDSDQKTLQTYALAYSPDPLQMYLDVDSNNIWTNKDGYYWSTSREISNYTIPWQITLNDSQTQYAEYNLTTFYLNNTSDTEAGDYTNVINKLTIHKIPVCEAYDHLESSATSYSCAENKIGSVVINKTNLSLTTSIQDRKKGFLKATVLSAQGQLPEKYKSVKWVSSNPKVAIVDQKTGEVKALKVGVSTISAVAVDGTKTSCKVVVKLPQAFMYFNNFKDIKSLNAEFTNDVKWMYNFGITTGTSSETYSPRNTVRRDQMAMFIYRLVGNPDYSNKLKAFKDVDKKAGSYESVMWLVNNKITTGFDNKHFMPSGSVNRLQMALFMYRLSGSPKEAVTNKYKVTDWNKGWNDECKQAINFLLLKGISTQKETAYNPSSPVTRAQMAAFMNRLYNNVLIK